jgi:DNA uptake protein ComE-like DNA-binding protein
MNAKSVIILAGVVSAVLVGGAVIGKKMFGKKKVSPVEAGEEKVNVTKSAEFKADELRDDETKNDFDSVYDQINEATDSINTSFDEANDRIKRMNEKLEQVIEDDHDVMNEEPEKVIVNEEELNFQQPIPIIGGARMQQIIEEAERNGIKSDFQRIWVSKSQPDGCIFEVGWKYLFEDETSRGCIRKIDSDGNIIIEQLYGFDGFKDIFLTAIVDPRMNHIVCGGTAYSDETGESCAIMACFEMDDLSLFDHLRFVRTNVLDFMMVSIVDEGYVMVGNCTINGNPGVTAYTFSRNMLIKGNEDREVELKKIDDVEECENHDQTA